MTMLLERRIRFDDPPTGSAWSFDERTSRYRDETTGRFLKHETVRTMRDSFLDARTERMDGLAGTLARGEMTAGEWEAAMRTEVKITYATQYVYGRGGLSQMTQSDWGSVGSLVKDQYSRLAGFADDVIDGRYTAAGVANRAGLYVGSSAQAHSKGQASAADIDLPADPGDGSTECGSNCRCYWEVDVQDDGSVEATWVASEDASTCDGCAANAAEWAPLVFDAPEDDEEAA